MQSASTVQNKYSKEGMSESQAVFSPSAKQNAYEEHSHPRLFSLGLESVPR
jgi:hypothetical protein